MQALLSIMLGDGYWMEVGRSGAYFLENSGESLAKPGNGYNQLVAQPWRNALSEA
jgi:hypothetical protein